MLSHLLCLISIAHPHLSLSSCALLSVVLSLFVMPKVDPNNKVGVIVHTVSKIVLGNHTAKNIYGNVNNAQTFIQGTVLNVFNRYKPGGKNELHDIQHNNQHNDQQDNQHRTRAGMTGSTACGACGWRDTWGSPSRHCSAGPGGNATISPEVHVHQLSRHHLCPIQSQPPIMQKINNQL